ncbi:MAG TPA: DoxX family protein [Lacunisphaera sp.]|nr:DoxX family protein [Lacunisphaera sp.]
MKKLLGLSFVSVNADLGLLLLRVAVSALMIRYHGWGKLTGWADESIRQPNLFSLAGARKEFHTFPDYIGIGSELSYVLVAWLETFGSLAIMAGLLTRLHSLGLCITMLVAWGFHHGMRLTGPGAGELPFSWAFVYLLLFLTGPGKYSLDQRLGLGASRSA